MSTFFGLSTAVSGLMAQRRAVDVTAQNIANANTPGYTRQRADLAAISAQNLSVYSVPRTSGLGVDVVGTSRLHDHFLDVRARTESGAHASYAEDSQALGRVEQVLGEPSDTGLAAQLTAFWDSWSAVSNNAGDLAARQELLSRAGTVVQTVADTARGLDQLWTAQRAQATALATEVDGLARSVAELNTTIAQQTAIGSPSNELLDARDALLSDLARLTGATSRPGAEPGSVDVLVGGALLVEGRTASAVAVDGPAAMGGAVTLTVGGTPVAPTGGRVQAVLGTLTTTLPTVRAELDAVAARLASSVNDVHAGGADLDGVTGRAFFTGTDASSLALAVTNPRHVAAATVGAGPLDGSLADRIGQLAHAADGPGAAWQQLVVGVGVDAQAATRRAGVQEIVSRQAEAARVAVSGVSIDEEVANMVAFQRAYEGAARVLSTLDQMLDTLVNRTGLVGR